MSLVVDASALLFATTDPAPSARRLLTRLERETTHAPHLVDAEVGAVLRRKVLRGEIDGDRAAAILSLYPVLVDHRYGHHGLLAPFAWRMRDNLSFYDALYVGLGVALDLEVVTLDHGMAEVPDAAATITVWMD